MPFAMTWAHAGFVYVAAYVAVVLALGGHHHARLIVGNVALLLPPLAPIAVLLSRRGRWRGRQAVFWGAVGAWPILWLIGQIGWSLDELFRALPLPWFKWHSVLQLSGSALPLIALIARPHHVRQSESTATTAIDIAGLACLTAFLYWSLIVAPGLEPAHAPAAVRALAIIGPSIRLATLIGLLYAVWSARETPWAIVYQRLAIGMALAFFALVGLSIATVNGEYQTGSPGDIGWMLPFWFAAWAMASSPASSAEAPRAIGLAPAERPSAALLCAAILTVPLVGYGARYLVPASPSVERMRELATAVALVCGIALVIVRLMVERRSVSRADRGVRLLATACEHAAELMMILRDDRVVYANPAFCQATGYAREELCALDPIRLVAPESTSDMLTLGNRLPDRKIVGATMVMVRKDGSRFAAVLSAAPIADASGRVTDVVAVVRDVTDDLHMRAQLVRSERMSAVGAFVSGVAHEINNPLQSVIGTMELLLGEADDPLVRADLERARAEAGRAGRIIRSLLAFVQSSAAERLLNDLNEIVQSTVAIRAHDLRQANIELQEEYGANLPVVLANREEIQQVVLNLVMNAQHAIASARGRGTLTIRTYAVGDRAVLEVSDDGPGVSPELAGRIFEPFFTTNTAGTGSGLGLSLALGIANAHDGTLELVPAAQGACFRLTLPGAGFPGPVQVH